MVNHPNRSRHASHTPGPWNIPMWRGKPQRMDGKWLVNAAVRPERGEKVGPPVADIHLSEADARLIAAAPELLATLEGARMWITEITEATDDRAQDMRNTEHRRAVLLDEIRAAIAKARPVG
jgi:hypothetical protein